MEATTEMTYLLTKKQKSFSGFAIAFGIYLRQNLLSFGR